MGECVVVYGKSGSGKSRSLINFAENEILLVNIEGKRLPFKKNFKYVAKPDPDSEDARAAIISQLHKMKSGGIKCAVIDDCGYLMTHKFMKRNTEAKGNGVFQTYNDIANDIYILVQEIKRKLPDDVIVYLMFHEDTNDSGQTIIRTIGKLLNEKVCIEGMVTVCLRAMSDNGRHFFRTTTDGYDITKTPEGMFPEAEIENDLKFVDDTIRKFYEIGDKK